MPLKIATWNVNSLRVRLPQVLQWLATNQPDILALQETKLLDLNFPLTAIQEAGYEVCYSGQKTYNGMAILSRGAGTDIITSIPGWVDPQRRFLGMTFQSVRILNLYVPNGESLLSEKYQYKLKWLQHFLLFLKQEIQTYPKLVIVGDFNIAPEEADVHDPVFWEGRVLFSGPERSALQDVLQLGLKDCFRLHVQPEKSFSWWDYRLNAFKRNLGLRIDHIFASPALSSQCGTCYIDKAPRAWERPSDHAPVVAEFLA